jgi:hypothetical protein
MLDQHQWRAASVADRPAIRASASGRMCRDVPHGQVTRTRKSPSASSSFLHGRMVRTRGGRVHAVPEARSPCMRSSGSGCSRTRPQMCRPLPRGRACRRRADSRRRSRPQCSTHENAREAAGVLVSAKSVGQFRRLRPANPAQPSRPSAIRPSAAGFRRTSAAAVEQSDRSADASLTRDRQGRGRREKGSSALAPYYSG